GIEAYTGNITFTEPTFSIETNHAALAICQSSTITATLLRNDGSDTPISGEEIEFTANSGGTLSSSTALTDEYGEAQVTLSSDSEIVTSVTAEYCDISISTNDITFTMPIIVLTANPVSIPAGGSSTITATVTDSSLSENPVADGTEILFTVLSGSGTLSSESATTTSGEAQVTVQHSSSEDLNSIEVQANYCGVSSEPITITIET
ncbi:MAG: Ig-like domain-containing protein, partial [Kosmotogaceae bacterium]